MASAKTRTFELTVEIQADSTADNQTIDLSDYVDIADNEAFLLQEWDIMLDPNQALPAVDVAEAIFQIADSNIADFVSINDRTSLGVARLIYGPLINGAQWGSKELSMSHDSEYGNNLIVSKTLWVRNETNSATAYTADHTLTLRGKIVRPTAKDYMALVLTQTGQIAA